MKPKRSDRAVASREFRAAARNFSPPSIGAVVLAGLLLLSAWAVVLARSDDHWWVGWIALLPLFVSIRVLTPLKALLSGSFWGLCLFVFLILAPLPPETEFASSVGSLILLTAVPGLYAYLGARLMRQVGFSPYLLALGWMGVELALSPLGLAGGLLVGTQGDGVVVHWLGNFAGCVVLAFLVAYVTAHTVDGIARLRVVIKRAQFVIGPLDEARRLFPQESFNILFRFIRPARPRAPPLRAR